MDGVINKPHNQERKGKCGKEKKRKERMILLISDDVYHIELLLFNHVGFSVVSVDETLCYRAYISS